MKKIILLLLIFTSLYSTEKLKDYAIIGNYHSDIQKLYILTKITFCKDVVWLKNGIILVHGYSAQNKNQKTEEAIISVDTKARYATKILSTLNTTTNNVYIVPDEQQNTGVIFLPHTTLIYKDSKHIEDKVKLGVISRPIVRGPREIIFYNNKGKYIYDGTDISPYIDLKNENKYTSQSLIETTHHWTCPDKNEIDAETPHPFLTIRATLSKVKGLLKFWNTKTNTIIKQQALPFCGIKLYVCPFHHLTFSPNGKQIACGLDSGLVIFDVPQDVLDHQN